MSASTNQTTNDPWQQIVDAAIKAGQLLAQGILSAIQFFAQPLGYAVVGGLVASAAMYIGELVISRASSFINVLRGAFGR